MSSFDHLTNKNPFFGFASLSPPQQLRHYKCTIGEKSLRLVRLQIRNPTMDFTVIFRAGRTQMIHNNFQVIHWCSWSTPVVTVERTFAPTQLDAILRKPGLTFPFSHLRSATALLYCLDAFVDLLMCQCSGFPPSRAALHVFLTLTPCRASNWNRQSSRRAVFLPTSSPPSHPACSRFFLYESSPFEICIFNPFSGGKSWIAFEIWNIYFANQIVASAKFCNLLQWLKNGLINLVINLI